MADAQSSSAGSGEGSSGTGVDAAMLRSDEDSSNDLAFQTGVWGVLYTVSKEKGRISLWFVIFRLFMDFLQLVLLTVNPQYGFDIQPKATWWRVVSFVQLNDFMTGRGYTFFLICLYMMVAGLVLAVALSLWVAYSFQNNNFSAIWPIQVLRGFGTIFFQVLDVASMTLFLMALDCQYFDIHAPAERYHNAEFPSVDCWTMPHFIHVGVAAVSLVVFVVMAALFQMGDMELNLATRNPLAMAHSKVEVICFLIKVVMTCASVFVNNIKWLSIIQLLSSLALVVHFTKWVPHYHNFTNHLRLATYAAVMYSAILFTALAFHWSADWKDPQAQQSFKRNVTLALLIGLAPCGLLGALGSWLRLRYYHVTVLNKFKQAQPDTKLSDIYMFEDSREVEILARCCRIFIDNDNNLDPDAIKLAEKVIKIGLAELPKDPYMVIFHSSFLIDVQQSYQSGYTQLQTAKKLDPSLLERFAIFTREQQHTQKSSGGHSGSMDLVAYVEFQRNYSLVLKVHREALLAMRFFWSLMLHHKVEFENLSKAVQTIDKAVRATEKAYRMVMQRHSNNVKMLRLYAKFLEQVKHDPWGAAKWFAEADKAEVADEEAKENRILKDLQLDPELRDAFLAARPAFGAAGVDGPDGGSQGVVLTNAYGVIQMASDPLNSMLGYAKKELHGKSVTAIIPPPFSSQHDGYMRTYMATGRAVIQGQVNHMLALHKGGHIIPVKLKVVKVTGNGEDAMFLAMMEDIPAPPGTAAIWVLPSGAVMSGDGAYTDMCGFKASEVAGLPLTSLIQDAKDVLTVLKTARTAFQENKTGDTHAALDAGTQNGTVSFHTTVTFAGRAHSQLAASESAALASARFSSPSPPVSAKGVMPMRSVTTSMSGEKGFDKAGVAGQSGLARRNARWDAIKVSTNKDAHGHPVSWTIVNGQVNHKYADPIHVTMNITNGGIGLHMFQVIRLQRVRPPAPPTAAAGALPGASPGALAVAGTFIKKLQASSADPSTMPPPPPLPPSYMLVADSKGRICHVTEGLAARLGSTARLVMANGMHNAMQSLILEPWSHLHTQRIAVVPPSAFPPFSCRSGLTILLACRSGLVRPGAEDLGIDGDGGRSIPYVPFRMNLRRKLIEDKLHHIATFKEVKPIQAVGERRLLMSLDQRGTILRVSRHTPRALFGFKPSHLVGRNISSLVDVLKPEPHSSSGGNPNEVKPETVLVEMALRALDSPGLSWRVGVQAPEETAQNEDGMLFGRIKARNIKPAVLRMFVRENAPEFDDEDLNRFAKLPRHLGFDAEDDEDLAGLEDLDDDEEDGNDFNSSAKQLANHSLEDHANTEAVRAGSELMTAKTAESDALDRAVAFMGSAVGLGESKKEEGPAMYGGAQEQAAVIEVELWRADLVMGYLQLDASGVVTGNSNTWDHMLYDAGLVLGLDPASLEGMRISDILPALKGKAAGELFNPQFSLGTSKKRGALKGPSPDTASRVSPIHILESMHGYDEEPLGLVVQAVRRAAGCWVVLRPHQPQCGRPDFQPFILLNSDESVDEKPAVPQKGRDAAGNPSTVSAPAKASVVQQGTRLSPPARVAQAVPRMDGAHDGTAKARSLLHNESTEGVGSPRNGANLPADEGNDDSSVQQQRAQGHVLPQESQRRRGDASRPVSRSASRGPIRRRHDSIKAWLLSDGAVYPVGDSNAAQEAVEAISSPQAAYGSVTNKNNRQLSALGAAKVAWPMAVDAPHDPAADGSDIGDKHDGSEGSGDNDAEVHEQGGNESGVYSHSVDASELDDAENAEYMVDDQAYKRGRRFKKLARLLSSPAVQAVRKRFYTHTLGLVGILLAAHLALFIVIFMLLKSQADYVFLLNQIGLAARTAADVAITSRDVYLILANRTVPGLKGMSSRADLQPTLDALLAKTLSFSDLHSGAYLGFDGKQSRIPSAYGMRFLWEQSSLNETQFFSVYANESAGNNTVKKVVNSTALFPLFRTGNRVVSHALEIANNAISYVAEGGNINQWAHLMYVLTNYNQSIAPGYLTTMDDMAFYVINKSSHVNQIQIMILATEGVALCLLAAVYMVHISTKVAKHRYSMYSVFMTIPQSLVRQLAIKRMNLTEEDEEEEDTADPAAIAAKNAASTAALNIGAARGPGASSMKSKTPSGTLDRKPSGQFGILDRLSKHFSRFLGRATVAPAAKRQLMRSHRQTMVLVIMFVVWGALVIIINGVGYMSLHDINSPIATFNIVNNVLVLYMKAIFYIQELCTLQDIASIAAYRAFVVEQLTGLKNEYQAMVYGKQVIDAALASTPHYSLVTKGMAFSIKQGAQILFNVHDYCMAQDPQDCPPRGDQNYQVFMNGLSQLFVRFVDMASNIGKLEGIDPALSGPEFKFYWTSRPHLMGGFDSLNVLYSDFVTSKYTNVRTMHTILLVLTIATLAFFLYFILRPFMRLTANEPRRIAELLSQLPPDVDVESVLQMRLLTAATLAQMPQPSTKDHQQAGGLLDTSNNHSHKSYQDSLDVEAKVNLR